MKEMIRILVVCPGNAMTAGPEAIHQLVATLNAMGKPAAVVYHPFNKVFETPAPYRHYAAPVARFEDTEGTGIIFPEIFTPLALRVKKAKAAIWWMSVNNYTCIRYGNRFRDALRYFKNWLLGRRPLLGIRSLKKLTHFAQSHYAKTFLKSHGINALYLSDPIPCYTEAAYLKKLILGASDERDNVILYNPKKGAKIIDRLQKAYPHYRFKPLIGYDREALAAILLKSKLYVDFGHHPGKDRLPREAGIHGCCVMTCLFGSAENAVDVPIPPVYKLDVTADTYVDQFGRLVAQIFKNFPAHFDAFSEYRAIISQEQALFDRQIEEAFLKGRSNEI